MPFEQVEKAANTATSFIQIGAQLLVGTMMVLFVGLPLVIGGIGSGWVPLILGVCAYVAAGRSIWRMIS